MYQIEVYAVGQDKMCVEFSIGYLVVSYLQSTKHQVVYVIKGQRIFMWRLYRYNPGVSTLVFIKFLQIKWCHNLYTYLK